MAAAQQVAAADPGRPYLCRGMMLVGAELAIVALPKPCRVDVETRELG